MAAPTFDLDGDNAIDQGSKYTKQFAFKEGSPATARDFSGMTARAMIREDFDDPTQIISFTATIPTPETQGIVQLDLTAVQTTALTPGTYKYDVEIYDAGDADNVERVIKGIIEITPEVTK